MPASGVHYTVLERFELFAESVVRGSVASGARSRHRGLLADTHAVHHEAWRADLQVAVRLRALQGQAAGSFGGKAPQLVPQTAGNGDETLRNATVRHVSGPAFVSHISEHFSHTPRRQLITSHIPKTR